MYHFDSHFSRCLWCKFILLYYLVEDLSHHLFRLFVASFDVSGSDSVAVCRFAFFLSLLIAVCDSSIVISGILFISLVSLLCSSMLFPISFSSCSSSISSCSLSSYNFLWNSPKILAIPFRDVMTSPFSFFTLVTSTLLLADLIPRMFLNPLKSSSIR